MNDIGAAAAQIGVTIGVGLMLDPLIVRTFVLPSWWRC
jgi:uncharacterized membrane protein YdfJ with MMPL/SSD domain